MSDASNKWRRAKMGVETTSASRHIHCTACYKSDCDISTAGEGACPMMICRECHVSMHECKMEDHQLICPREMAPCINAQYGCGVKTRRDKLGAHLESCAASTVACVYTWNREFIDVRAKKELKRRLAEGDLKKPDVTSMARCGHELDLDVQLALSDQHMLGRYYAYGREFRRRERDGRIPTQLYKVGTSVLERNARRQERQLGENSAWVDSSEAEEREMERNVRIKKGAFADCYLCQREPGSQHLHVLGNMATAAAMAAAAAASENSLPDTDALDTDGSSTRRDPKAAVANVLTANSLYLKLDIAFAGAISQLRTAGMRRLKLDRTANPSVVPCGEVVRRDEFHAHQLYHQRVQELLDGRYVRRCPMWQDGCAFWCRQLRPLEGRLRVNTFIATDAVQWEPMPETDSAVASGSGVETLLRDFPTQVLRCIEPHLDSASLRCLAGTCRKLRTTLFCHFPHRLAAELKWRRVPLDDGAGVHWLEDGVVWRFTAAHRFPSAKKWLWEPVAQLADHLASCEFKRTVDYGDARLDLRLYHGDTLPPNNAEAYFGNLFD